MLDVNRELENSLQNLSCALVYRQPSGFNALPVVSYYNITESASFSADNEEQMIDGVIQLDVWAKLPSQCGEIALEINGLLTEDGWVRQFSMDVPKQSKERAYHKTLRYTKTFLNR